MYNKTMKKLVLAAVAALLVSCGSNNNSSGGKCSGSYTGTYKGTSVANTLTLDASCNYSYTDVTGCQSTGTYGAPLSTGGSVLVTITSSTGGACTPAGQYTCSYTISNSTMSVDCGTGAVSYTKQ